MRLLVDAHVFDGMFQGSRTYLQGLYSEMIEQKPEWQFFLLGHDLTLLQQAFGTGENISYIQLKSRNKFKRLLLEIPKIIKKHKIDYAHFQYITPLQKPCKFIVTTHDILFEEPRFEKYFSKKYRLKNGLLFKRSAKTADILLTVSEYSKEMISKFYLDSTSQAHVVANAVNKPKPEITPIDIKEHYGCEKYLLYVSRIEPRKNHLGLLKAYVNLDLDQKGYQLVFIGARDIPHNEFEAVLEHESDRLKGKVHFFENVPNEHLDAFFRQCEIVVYPSFAEGFGIPPLEGAMYKKQVVCSSATAMAEFDFFRYHIDPEDQKALEEAVLNALSDKDEAYLNSTADTISDRYNWKRSAADLIRIIENQ